MRELYGATLAAGLIANWCGPVNRGYRYCATFWRVEPQPGQGFSVVGRPARRPVPSRRHRLGSLSPSQSDGRRRMPVCRRWSGRGQVLRMSAAASQELLMSQPPTPIWGRTMRITSTRRECQRRGSLSFHAGFLYPVVPVEPTQGGAMNQISGTPVCCRRLQLRTCVGRQQFS